VPADGVAFAMTAADPFPDPDPGFRAPRDLSADLVFAATTGAVREGLARILALPILADLGADDRGTTELLLAEALNNVVEHAYANWPGEIRLRLSRKGGDITVCICDQGLPMPENAPPRGTLPVIGAPEHLPEGGFGWFLIRNLARDLAYRRQDGSNALSFRIPVDNQDD